MSNNIVKALKCLASQTESGSCYSDCYNKNTNNKQAVCREIESNDTELVTCPYYQSEFSNFLEGIHFNEDGNCRELLNKAADFIESNSTKNNSWQKENNMIE